MTYEESMEEGVEVTAAEARREVARHSASWEEFLADRGVREEYSAREVLEWLGY